MNSRGLPKKICHQITLTFDLGINSLNAVQYMHNSIAVPSMCCARFPTDIDVRSADRDPDSPWNGNFM